MAMFATWLGGKDRKYQWSTSRSDVLGLPWGTPKLVRLNTLGGTTMVFDGALPLLRASLDLLLMARWPTNATESMGEFGRAIQALDLDEATRRLNMCQGELSPWQRALREITPRGWYRATQEALVRYTARCWGWRSVSGESDLGSALCVFAQQHLRALLLAFAVTQLGFDPEADIQARLSWIRQHQHDRDLVEGALACWTFCGLPEREVAETYLRDDPATFAGWTTCQSAHWHDEGRHPWDLLRAQGLEVENADTLGCVALREAEAAREWTGLIPTMFEAAVEAGWGIPLLGALMAEADALATRRPHISNGHLSMILPTLDTSPWELGRIYLHGGRIYLLERVVRGLDDGEERLLCWWCPVPTVFSTGTADAAPETRGEVALWLEALRLRREAEREANEAMLPIGTWGEGEGQDRTITLHIDGREMRAWRRETAPRAPGRPRAFDVPPSSPQRMELSLDNAEAVAELLASIAEDENGDRRLRLQVGEETIHCRVLEYEVEGEAVSLSVDRVETRVGPSGLVTWETTPEVMRVLASAEIPAAELREARAAQEALTIPEAIQQAEAGILSALNGLTGTSAPAAETPPEDS